MCCAEVAGGGFRIFEKCVSRDFQKWALDTKTARLRDASLCVAGSQAARRPERLGGQGGCPRRMPRWLYQTLEGVGGWEKTRGEEAQLRWKRNAMQKCIASMVGYLYVYVDKLYSSHYISYPIMSFLDRIPTYPMFSRKVKFRSLFAARRIVADWHNSLCEIDGVPTREVYI